jgi:hypothetical protein
MIRRSESEGNVKGYPFGEQPTNDDVNCMMYESEQGGANLKTNGATANYPTYNLRKGAVSEVDMIRRSESEGNVKGYPFGEQPNNDDVNCMMYDSEQVTRCRLNACCSGEGISNDREGEKTGEETLNSYDICTANRLGRYEERNVGDAETATDAHSAIADDRAITKDQTCKVINELENLTYNQKQKLSAVLQKHQGNLTKKPGKCKSFEYTFQVQGQLPKSTYSRPLPFALRPTVSQEIRQLLKDDILEKSHSAYLNPLTVVHREGKSPRNCVDARKINQITLPDRTKVAPVQEILQRFHGTKYITTLDLSSAFLQIPLDEASRKYNAFEFQSKVYRYKRIRYGFRNSLSGFIRALQTVLGDETFGYVINCVDDILIHVFSRGFDEHMNHLDTVLSKLTSAGFTINARKRSFCKSELKFLGHVVSREKLVPDPQRIEVILNYPAPKKQKQLRRFLGVCGFHQRFIVNYASYVVPLLVLLQKQSKWRWSTEKFAHNIHLIHSDDNLPCIISRVIPPSTYELSTTKGKIRGEFSKKALKPYLEEENPIAEGSR